MDPRLEAIGQPGLRALGLAGSSPFDLYGVMLLDTLGKIVDCNDDLARMTDYAVADLLGRMACDVFPNLPLSARSAEFNRAMVRTRFEAGEWSPEFLVCRNGRRFPADLCMTLVALEGGEAFVLETCFARPQPQA